VLLLRPAGSRGLACGFASFFRRHLCSASFAASQAALPAKSYSGRVFSFVGIDRGNLARGLADNLAGKLVRIGRTLARAVRHTPRVASQSACANFQSDPVPPDDLKPGELKRIRQGDPLPESHRG